MRDVDIQLRKILRYLIYLNGIAELVGPVNGGLEYCTQRNIKRDVKPETFLIDRI